VRNQRFGEHRARVQVAGLDVEAGEPVAKLVQLLARDRAAEVGPGHGGDLLVAEDGAAGDPELAHLDHRAAREAAPVVWSRLRERGQDEARLLGRCGCGDLGTDLARPSEGLERETVGCRGPGRGALRPGGPRGSHPDESDDRRQRQPRPECVLPDVEHGLPRVSRPSHKLSPF
jgi:hypothetical protein